MPKYSAQGILYTTNSVNTAYVTSATNINLSAGSVILPYIIILNISYVVTSIAANAFLDCTNLTSITIPDSVTSIGNTTFKNCSSLTSITIPAGVASIGNGTFSGCSLLTSTDFTDGSVCESIGISAFKNCIALASITIPASVKSIGNDMLEGCSKLATVIFENPNNLTSVGINIFTGATAIKTVYYNIYSTQLSAGAINIQTQINTVNNPNPSYIYIYTANSITYTSNNTGNIMVVTNANNSTLSAGSVIRPYIIISGISYVVTSIAANAFLDCTNLTSITIPDSVTSIGNNTFKNCSSLTSITIPAGVASIGNSTFSGCFLLTSSAFTDGSVCESIGISAFTNCVALSSITIPASVKSIGDYMLEGCSKLATVIFENPNNLTTLGTSIFTGAAAIKTVYYNIYSTQLSVGAINIQTQINMVNYPYPEYIYLIPTPVPICFPAGTPVLTNLGEVAIEKLNPAKHTIRGNQIVAIAQSRPLQKYIVCFEKDSLSKNVPSQQTLCSMEHKVFYMGEMTKARNLVEVCENVTFVDYNGETLYNVLLKKHDKMVINNLICETLSPENMIAKIIQIKDVQQKHEVMSKLTKIITEGNVEEYKKLGRSLNEPNVNKSRRLL